MAGSLSIQHLANLGELKVKQKTKFAIGNRYSIQTTNGDEILYAREDSSGLGALLGGNDRSFQMNLFDTQDKVVISLRRPYSFGPDKMDVSMGGQLVSIVRKEATWFKPVLSINTASDTPILRIKGPFSNIGECDYQLLGANKKPIGVITHKNRFFAASDHYYISFPHDLDVRFKAAVIGSCLLIDFLYYEA